MKSASLILALTLAACVAPAPVPAPAPAPAAMPAPAPAPIPEPAHAAPALELPGYGADKPLPIPEIAQRTLANGLTVWVVPRNGLPRVDLVLVVRGGLAADGKKSPARSELLAPLLREGTARRSSQAIAEELQSIGGSLSSGAGAESIRINGQALASQAPKLFELLADVARNPGFPKNEVALAKSNALETLKANEADPTYQVSRALDRHLWGEHPYAWLTPTAASIESTTREWLVAEHRKRFRPDRALLVVTGRIDSDAAFALAQKRFGDWKGHGAPLPETPVVPRAWKPGRVLVDRPGSVQSNLRIARTAIPATDPDLIPLTLTNTILGGGFDSRINRNLREEKGYTYGAGTDVFDGRAGGAVIGSADVRNEVTGAALQEFFRELDRLGQEPVSVDEMLRAKRYTAGVYMFRNQLQGSLIGTLANNWVVGLPPEHLSSYVGKTQAVTIEQVQEMARKYFSSRDQSIVIVGDKAAIEAQLQPFGEFQPFKP
jgi:predicted Zn-dependent peptidase